MQEAIEGTSFSRHGLARMANMDRPVQLVDICELILCIVRELVIDSARVRVFPVRADDGGVTVIHVVVATGLDKGKVIGRAGRTAQALRIVVRAILREENAAFRIEIFDNAEVEALRLNLSSTIGY